MSLQRSETYLRPSAGADGDVLIPVAAPPVMPMDGNIAPVRPRSRRLSSQLPAKNLPRRMSSLPAPAKLFLISIGRNS